MVTKEAILKESRITGKCVFHNSDLIEMDIEDIKYAMNEYALGLSIEFGKWIIENTHGGYFIDGEGKYQIYKNEEGEDKVVLVSAEELFLEFVKYRTKYESTTL